MWKWRHPLFTQGVILKFSSVGGFLAFFSRSGGVAGKKSLTGAFGLFYEIDPRREPTCAHAGIR